MTHNVGSPQELKRALLTMKTSAQVLRIGIPGMIKRDHRHDGLVRPRQADKRTEEKCGGYRTKRVILEIYDEMAEAMRTWIPYKTRLDPPPAYPRCCHPSKEGTQT
jgi:hypothetical protein